jgi:PAS domain S-box-containing protein
VLRERPGRRPRDSVIRAMSDPASERHERAFETAFEAAPIAAFVIDLDERIARANYAATLLLGRPREVLEGSTIADHVHEQDQHCDLIRRAIAEPTKFTWPLARERRYLDAAGRRLFVRESVARVYDSDHALVGLTVHLIDHTERDYTLERLARYQLLAARARDIILFVDALDSHIVEANDAAVSAYGYSRDELLAKSIADLRAPGTIPDVSVQMNRAYEQGVLFETSHRRKDGTTFPVEVSSKGTSDADRRILLSIIRDISERKEAEHALRTAMETTQRLAQSKSQFLANMSHELRTPLNAILGFGRVLERETHGVLNERQREYVNDIVQSGAHMLRLVNDLLDLRRIEEGRQEIDARLQSVRPAIDEAVRMIRPLAQARSQRFEIDLSEGRLDAWIDARALVQVLVNLLGNAVKFTPENGRIALRAEEQRGEVRISVEDDGVGISEDDQTRVFHYFERARASRRNQGTGLGLALTQALVHQLGGSVQLRSALGAGSCFTVTLRCTPESE